MNLVKDCAQRIIKFLQDKLSRLWKMKRKNKWKLAGVVLAAVLVVVVVGRLIVGRKGSRSALAETTVQSATAETGSISTTVEGTGTLQQGTSENVTVPVGVEVEEILVEAGDAVTAGQQLATVNTASVAAQLLEVEENLDDVKDDIADLSDDADEEGTTEYLEALVLKGRKKELQQAKKELKTLLDTGAIEADSDGIIGEIYVSEDTEVSRSSDSSDSASTASSTSAVTETSTPVVKTDNTTNATAVSASAVKLLSSTGTIKALPLSDGGTEKSMSNTETTAITSCSLSVTAPVTGKAPQSSIEGTDRYTGKISWNCAESVFQAGTAYTADIELTAKNGYCFSTDTIVSVSGASSVSKEVSQDGSTMTISAVFEATAAASTGSSVQSGSSTETTAGTESSSSAVGSSSSSTTASSGSSNSSHTGETSGNDNSSAGDSTESKNSGTKGSTEDSNVTKDTGAAGGNGASGQSGSGFSGSSAGGSAGSGNAAGGTSTASVSTDSTGSSASSGDEYSPYETAAFSIVNDKEAVVSIQVDELDILSVEEGQTAAITMDAVEGQEFEGTITKVSATASGDSSSAKYPVEITLEKTDDMLYGMSASATIQVDEAENAVLIPVNALQEEGNSTFVYTENDGDGNLSGKVEVTTGLSNGSQVEIKSGLEEGDTVYYLRTGTDAGDSGNVFQSMGGGKSDQMPSGGRGGSESGGREAGGAGGPGGNPGGFAQ